MLEVLLCCCVGLPMPTPVPTTLPTPMPSKRDNRLRTERTAAKLSTFHYEETDLGPMVERADTFDECWQDAACQSEKCFLNYFLPPHDTEHNGPSQCVPRNSCHSYSVSDEAPQQAVDLCENLFELMPKDKHHLLPREKCKRTGRYCHVDDSEFKVHPEGPDAPLWRGVDARKGAPWGFDVYSYHCENLEKPCLTPAKDKCPLWTGNNNCEDMHNLLLACPDGLMLQGWRTYPCDSRVRNGDLTPPIRVALILKCALRPNLMNWTMEVPRVYSYHFPVVPPTCATSMFYVDNDMDGADMAVHALQLRVSQEDPAANYQMNIVRRFSWRRFADGTPDAEIKFASPLEDDALFDTRYDESTSSASIAAQMHPQWCPPDYYLLNMSLKKYQHRPYIFFELSCSRLEANGNYAVRKLSATCDDKAAMRQPPLMPFQEG